MDNKTSQNLMVNMLRGIGFDGGLPSILQQLIDHVDQNQVLSPGRRLQQYRASPEYTGNSPVGVSREDTQRLREMQPSPLEILMKQQ